MEIKNRWIEFIKNDLNESGFPSKPEVVAIFARFPAFSSLTPKQLKGQKHALITQFFTLSSWTEELANEFLRVYSQEIFNLKYEDYQKDLDHADHDREAQKRSKRFRNALESLESYGLLYQPLQGLRLKN